MNLNVSSGQWITFFKQQMQSYSDFPICFVVPSSAHVHAFLIAQESFPKNNFTFKLKQQAN